MIVFGDKIVFFDNFVVFADTVAVFLSFFSMKSTVQVQVSLKTKICFYFALSRSMLKIHELLASFEWKVNREKIPLQFLIF